MTHRPVPASRAGPADGVAAGRPGLPDRPLISTPRRLWQRGFLDAERERVAGQPGLGLAGTLLVLPVAVFLGVGAGGLEPSLRVLGPLSTFGLPVVAMIAFWWEDWPGSRLRPGWSGLLNTALVVAGAVLLTFAGQMVVGRLDLRGVFDPTPGAGDAPTFPATMPLAAGFFVVMLQLTLVSEGWPLRRLGRLASGPAALVISAGIAVGLYVLVVRFHPAPCSGLRPRSGPLSGGELGALLVVVGVWQVLFFVAMRGWPFAEVASRALRLVTANLLVVGAGVLTFAVLRGVLGWSASAVSAAGGSVVAAVLLQAMLFEGWPRSDDRPDLERLTTLGVVTILAGLLYCGLTAVARNAYWTIDTPDEWVAYAGLNAIGAAVILHVAIGGRWPFIPGACGETHVRESSRQG